MENVLNIPTRVALDASQKSSHVLDREKKFQYTTEVPLRVDKKSEQEKRAMNENEVLSPQPIPSVFGLNELTELHKLLKTFGIEPSRDTMIIAEQMAVVLGMHFVCRDEIASAIDVIRRREEHTDNDEVHIAALERLQSLFPIP